MLKILILSFVIISCVYSEDNCKCLSKQLCARSDKIDNHTSLKVKCDEEDEVMCCIKKTEKQKRQVQIAPAGCGIRNTQGIGSRRPGAQADETNFGEIPWMVGIYTVRVDPVTNVERDNYVCGGSLINPRAVLTAAHCVLGKNSGKRLKVRAGEWDIQNTNEMYPHQDRNVIEINTDKDYRAATLYKDIAILILNEAIELGPHINTICLPQNEQTITNGDCFVNGWGKNKAGIEATVLRTVQQPIVDNNKCIDILRTTKLGEQFELHYSFICAGGVIGQDVCGGYGGSPLVCPIPGQQGRYYQAGIVSWGIGCGDHVPGVYTNIAIFRNWIDEQLQYKRLNESFYKY